MKSNRLIGIVALTAILFGTAGFFAGKQVEAGRAAEAMAVYEENAKAFGVFQISSSLFEVNWERARSGVRGPASKKWMDDHTELLVEMKNVWNGKIDFTPKGLKDKVDPITKKLNIANQKYADS